MAKRYTIEAMHARALARGGKCLSTTYTNRSTALNWACAKGHTWSASPQSTKSGWCPHCTGNAPLSIEVMHARASLQGGKCLSTVYVNTATKLQWECAKGHVWAAIPNTILKAWCPHCSRRARLTLETMVELAQSRGGECISTAYVNCESRLEWKCHKGHTWKATPNNVRANKRWCPYCRNLVGETNCREWFERHFSRPFPKANPEWLIRSTGTRLQLDGYNAELRLAFEYQGKQHYQFVPMFHRSPLDLEDQKARDAEKLALCNTYGVRLIVVPYYKALEPFLRGQFESALLAQQSLGLPKLV